MIALSLPRRPSGVDPIIIPEEPKRLKEVGNQLPGVEDYDSLNDVLESIMTPEKTKALHHAILDKDSDESTSLYDDY